MTLDKIMSIPEARELVELIEELIGESETELVRIRTEYVSRLAECFGYVYKI